MTIPRVRSKIGKIGVTWSNPGQPAVIVSTSPIPGQPLDQAPPIPATLDELPAQSDCATAGMRIPARMTGLRFVHGDGVMLLIHLPAKVMLIDTEQTIEADLKACPLPALYDTFWGRQPPHLDRDNVRRFDASRIGETPSSDSAVGGAERLTYH